MLFRSDEAQAGIKISGRNINNLRYPDDTTLMAESEEELKRSTMPEMARELSLFDEALLIFFLFYFIFKLYIIVLVLPNIKMNPPQVYVCSPP